ncbi:MAG: hypothetical protein A2925_01650 [Candidatus Yanofskybacteria bacterium RIFCSPLOWO2_01_FULL_44_22]|uniref:Peptidase S8/S53 domain-containing protein n=2 Tax=Candidatus Yanofskyibacteriota TaxID=1752733 RepID=A0A1F8GIR3_9BACT|nr:MAG: hypothetical protein A2659_04870 [Candidatus Yanofskybacteria bacterium RIFCSPHIGHO2_01_FULL_44_24]OGN25284.1 MAG: hypothetical protein A2925_01650 [Candidatus Yanofskybacteria bacterium RIFCSPLOWO2_01_FULL_44_22]
MKTKKIAYFIVILSLLLGANFSYGASEDTRYFVKSASGLWRKSLGARHVFGNGFTADLSAWQLKVAGMFGLEVEPVRKLYILPEAEAATLTQTSAKGRPVSRQVPSAQVQWGIKMIYNDSTLEKSSGGLDVNVAILDTGVLKTHPDLKNRIKDCKDFTSLKQPIVNGQCEDKNGHGTHVAGVIAADGGDDARGIYGVAPEANVWAYKVCGTNGSCWSDDIASALMTAADRGANVVNLSLGSDASNQLIADAVSYATAAGVLVVAAAGNDGPYVGSIDYPGAYSSVVAVAAVDAAKDVPGWSSRGLNSSSEPYVVEEGDVEFAAPGVSIESTWKDGGYAVSSGTSMATPHVAGLAAKLWQVEALDQAGATRGLLQDFAHDLGLLSEEGLPVDDDASGFGLPQLR